MEIPLPGGVANVAGDITASLNPLTSGLGHLSVQDRAFLDAFNRQEQQELHGVAQTDPSTILGQLEQTVQTAYNRSTSHQPRPSSIDEQAATHPPHHDIVSELAPEEVRWFYKREADKEWTPFMGYDSLRVELRYRHIWQTKWAAAAAENDPHTTNRRARSLNRTVHYEQPEVVVAEPEPESISYSASQVRTQQQQQLQGGPNPRGRHKSYRHYRSAETFLEEDRDMRIVVRGGVYEVDLAEWKCHSIYWPGEAFDIHRGTWFQEFTWQPLQCEYADRIEQEHLNRFRGHKMADYVWDTATSTRLEKQVGAGGIPAADLGHEVHHTMNFPEFHVDWISPEEVYLHRETASSQLYRGLSASLGFKKPVGERLFRGYRELCQHTDRLADISHIVFVVHGVGQVVDDTTIIRNTNIMRDNIASIMAKHFPRFQMESGQRVEFFPVEWRSSLRLDEGMVEHITPHRILGLRNLLNSSAMDIMYYTSPLYRMEIWQVLQEELNRLYEMFVQRNPYFESNGGRVSIVAHSLGCVVTYDILTGWTQDVEHSWYNLQTRGGGSAMNDLKRSRRFRHPGNPGANLHAAQATSGLHFRIENFFCLGSPLSVFLSLRWRDPQNQEYHEHILPRSLCKYLYNIYHPCDPVAYRVEPIFMKFYSQVEPIHLYGAGDSDKVPYGQQPLQPLQAARKSEDEFDSSSLLPVNIANGSINISVGKMAAGFGSPAAALPKMPKTMSPSLSLPKIPNGGTAAAATTTTTSTTSAAGATANAAAAAAASASSTMSAAAAATGAAAATTAVGDAVGQVAGGIWGMVRDAAAAVTPASAAEAAAHLTTTTTTTTATNHHVQDKHEVKLPDGQRLAYRMDYMLRETGNTYIAAITSHTAYWSNPDVAYFMLTKLHPELDKEAVVAAVNATNF